MPDTDPVSSRAAAFANQFSQGSMTGFTEPPLVDPFDPDAKQARLEPSPDPGPMPAPPRAEIPDDDEPTPHPPWPEELVQGRGPTIAEPSSPGQERAELVVLDGHASYKGQTVSLNDHEKAAVGRIVLESAQRVIREHLAQARKLAPRRRRTVPEPAPEPPKATRRGRKRREPSSDGSPAGEST